MKLKSTFCVQDKNLRDLDPVKEYPTLEDFIKEQGVLKDFPDFWDKNYMMIIHLNNFFIIWICY